MTNKTIGLTIGGLVLLMVFFVYMAAKVSYEEHKKWRAFAVKHNCKVVAHKKGQTTTGVGPTIGSNGGVGVTVITGRTRDQVAYLCDDGVTYWRSK